MRLQVHPTPSYRNSLAKTWPARPLRKNMKFFISSKVVEKQLRKDLEMKEAIAVHFISGYFCCSLWMNIIGVDAWTKQSW